MHASPIQSAPEPAREPPLAPESWESRFFRWRMNLFPAYWGSGARVTYVSPDFHEIHIALPLSWRTRNLVGTIYGGAITSATDPFFMLMFMRLLGPDYIVWDKAASVRFLKPGRDTLYARFIIPEREVDDIKNTLESQPKLDRIYVAELTSADGTPHARIERTVYFRRK